MERRHFLKTAVLGAVAGTVGLKGMKLFASEKTAPGTIPGKDDIPDLVAIMGGEPEQLYARAIQEMGGMSRYIKRNESSCKAEHRMGQKPRIRCLHQSGTCGCHNQGLPGSRSFSGKSV